MHKRSAEDDGEVVLFEQKCKLFFNESKARLQTAALCGCCAPLPRTLTTAPGRMQEAGWASRGLGDLQLRRPLDAGAGGSARLLMRNDAGKLMLNAKLYAAMKIVQLQGKSVCTNLFNTVQAAGAEEGAAGAAPKETPTCVHSRCSLSPRCA